MRVSICLAAAVVLAFAIWAAGQDEKAFFRIVSPTNTQIVGLGVEGVLVWTNGAVGVTCTVQRAKSLNGATNWADFVQHVVTGAVMSLRVFDLHAPEGMALIPAGSFLMGDSLDGTTSAQPVHTVYVSAFYMDKTEVTKAKWDEVYAWAVANGYTFDHAGSGKAASHPVQTVSWYDCVKWCNARSEKEGLPPCYVVSGATYKTGQSAPDCVWTADGYRMPTEAEWEKAARGGLSGKRFPFGDTITHRQANYYSTTSYAYDTSSTRGYHPTYKDGTMPCTSPVGAFAANGYGLYDMVGNVWEWCWDWYDSTYYGSSLSSDPRGPSSGSNRVSRGGSWDYYASYCSSAYRISGTPKYSSIIVGFRTVRRAQ